jgi:hypothetical protein
VTEAQNRFLENKINPLPKPVPKKMG